jgi:hypothetical protein
MLKLVVHPSQGPSGEARRRPQVLVPVGEDDIAVTPGRVDIESLHAEDPRSLRRGRSHLVENEDLVAALIRRLVLSTEDDLAGAGSIPRCGLDVADVVDEQLRLAAALRARNNSSGSLPEDRAPLAATESS